MSFWILETNKKVMKKGAKNVYLNKPEWRPEEHPKELKSQQQRHSQQRSKSMKISNLFSSSQSDEELDKIVEALFENETKKVAPPTKTAQTKTAPTKTAPTNAAPKKSVHPFPEKVPVLALPNPAEKWSQVETALLMLLISGCESLDVKERGALSGMFCLIVTAISLQIF